MDDFPTTLERLFVLYVQMTLFQTFQHHRIALTVQMGLIRVKVCLSLSDLFMFHTSVVQSLMSDVTEYVGLERQFSWNICCWECGTYIVLNWSKCIVFCLDSVSLSIHSVMHFGQFEHNYKTLQVRSVMFQTALADPGLLWLTSRKVSPDSFAHRRICLTIQPAHLVQPVLFDCQRFETHSSF